MIRGLAALTWLFVLIYKTRNTEQAYIILGLWIRARSDKRVVHASRLRIMQRRISILRQQSTTRRPKLDTGMLLC